MSFSDEFMPDDDDSNSFDALLGLLTPPVSPEKVSKVQDSNPEDLVPRVWAAVQRSQAQAFNTSRAPEESVPTVADEAGELNFPYSDFLVHYAAEEEPMGLMPFDAVSSYLLPAAPAPASPLSRSPQDSASSSAEVDEGSESDAEGEVDTDLFQHFLVEPQPALQPEEIQPILPAEPPILNSAPEDQPRQQSQTGKTRNSFTCCDRHSKVEVGGKDKQILDCEDCEMKKLVNTLIQEKRRSKQQKEVAENNKAGQGKKPRFQSEEKIKRDEARKKTIRKLVLSKDGMDKIRGRVSPKQFKNLERELERRKKRHQSPFNGSPSSSSSLTEMESTSDSA